MALRIILSLIAFSASSFVFSQATPKMVAIPSGGFTTGDGYQYKIIWNRMHLVEEDTAFARINSPLPTIGEAPYFNTVQRQVNVTGFYLAETETSNEQYLSFLMDSLMSPQERAELAGQLKLIAKGKTKDSTMSVYAVLFERASAKGLLPDQECWENDYRGVMMNPYVRYYFSHPAFGNFPVVGVNWHQANAYCSWLSTKTNKALLAKGEKVKPDFRLPTEMEWEYAAFGHVPPSEAAHPKAVFPWPGFGYSLIGGGYPANLKVGKGDFISDGYMATCPVKEFPKNGFGLYNMGGNVSEWTLDAFLINRGNEEDLTPRREPQLFEARPEQLHTQQRVIKGGSWADYAYAAYCGSRAGMDELGGYSRVGFRIAQTMTEVGK